MIQTATINGTDTIAMSQSEIDRIMKSLDELTTNVSKFQIENARSSGEMLAKLQALGKADRCGVEEHRRLWRRCDELAQSIARVEKQGTETRAKLAILCGSIGAAAGAIGPIVMRLMGML